MSQGIDGVMAFANSVAWRVLIGSAIIITIGLLVAWIVIRAEKQGPAVGDVVCLTWGDDTPVLVSTGMLHFDEVLQAVRAKDTFGQRELVVQTKALLLTPGTSARVLAQYYTYWEVRILDGPYRDRAVWVVPDCARK